MSVGLVLVASLALALPPGWRIEIPDEPKLRSARVDSVAVGAPGVAWGTEVGLFLQKPDGGLVYWHRENSPLGVGEFAALTFRGQEIWTTVRTTTTANGLFRWDGRAWTTYRETRNALLTERVSCLHNDYDDYVWVGFDTLGVSRFIGDENPLHLFKEFTVKKGILGGPVRAILLQGTHLWIGTDRGICRYRLERESLSGLNVDTWTWNAGFPARGVTDLVLTGDAHLAAGCIYAGTERGLAVFDGHAWRLLAAAEGLKVAPVIRLAVDGEALWIAGFRGLQRYAAGRFDSPITAADGLPASEITAVAVEPLADGSARIHVGTPVGGATLIRPVEGR